MTAIEAAPVEIWIEIIKQLLDDPALFRTNPFYLGCNLHTALTEWYDYGPIERFHRQRGILRLVSRSWKDLVDLRFDWVYTKEKFHHSMLIESKWRSTKLMQLGVKPWSCACTKSCVCINRDYSSDAWRLDQGYTDTLLHNLCSTISPSADAPPLPMKKAVLAARIWGTIDKEIPLETIARVFSNVQSLEIPDRVWRRLPNILPNLSHLSIGLDTNPWGDNLIFPKLTTLKVRLYHSMGDLMGSWTLPKLQHLEVIDGSLSAATGAGPQIFRFLRRGWPLLTSLRLISLRHPITLPQDLWSNLPHLEYFGSSTLQGHDHRPTTLDHSLHTLGLLDNDDSHFARRVMAGFIPLWLNLKVVADFHEWENVHKRGARTISPKLRFLHSRKGSYCEGCILDMGSLCEERGLRYEDRWGRTREEFEADSVSH